MGSCVPPCLASELEPKTANRFRSPPGLNTDRHATPTDTPTTPNGLGRFVGPFHLANIPRPPPFMAVRRRVDNVPTCHDDPLQFASVRPTALPKRGTLAPSFFASTADTGPPNQ